MALTSVITGIQLEGFEEFLNAVKQMPDKMKKREITGIMKMNLRPVVKAIKTNTPVSGYTHVRKTKNVYHKRTGELKRASVTHTYESGNLKRSIGVKAFTKGDNPTVFAGIQKGKNDGWYGFFVERGTKHIAARNFIAQAAAVSVPTATENLQNDIRNYIVKNAKRLGLDAK